jgi:RNA-directed DNA polymerase
MELLFGAFTKTGKYVSPVNRKGINKQILFFRYADDFVVFAISKEVLESHVIPKITAFLAEIGLSLNLEKTRIVNISEGFEFLGFRFQRYFRKDGTIKELDFCPSRKRLDQFLEKTKEYIKLHWNKDVAEIIKGLNYKIVGFCNYFKWSKANRAFGYLSYRLWEQLWRWAMKRHPWRRRKWIRQRYWQSTERSNWTFTWQGKTLVQPYTRYEKGWWKRPKLRILASPFDPSLKDYWEKRRKGSIVLGNHAVPF